MVARTTESLKCAAFARAASRKKGIVRGRHQWGVHLGDGLHVVEHAPPRYVDPDGLHGPQLLAICNVEVVQRDRLLRALLQRCLPLVDGKEVAGVEHQVAPDEPRAVGEPVGVGIGGRPEEEPRRRERSCCEDHDLSREGESLPPPAAVDLLDGPAARL